MKKLWALAVLLSLAIPAVAGMACPKSLAGPTMLDEDLFCPVHGPSLDAAGVVLNCHGHRILGAGAGIGLALNADGSMVQDCLIEGFAVGISAVHAGRVRIQESTIQENKVGIVLDHVAQARIIKNRIQGNALGILGNASSIALVENEFQDNQEDVRESLPQRDLLTGAAVANGEVPQPGIHVVENVVSEEMLSVVGVSPASHAEAAQKVDVSKSYLFQNGRVTFLIVLRSRETVHDVVVYESISKNLTPSAFSISSSWPFSIVEADPILRFPVGSLEKGREIQLDYSAATDASSIVVPSSIVALEPAATQEVSVAVQALAAVFVVAFLSWFAASRKQSRQKMMHASLAGLLVGLFLMLLTNSVVLISLAVHEALLVFAFVLASLYYGIQGFLEWAGRSQ